MNASFPISRGKPGAHHFLLTSATIRSSVNPKADLSGETEFAPDLGWGRMRVPQAWPSTQCPQPRSGSSPPKGLSRGERGLQPSGEGVPTEGLRIGLHVSVGMGAGGSAGDLQS